MTGVFDDLKWALRSLTRTPGFTLLAGLLLALGIGANLAIYTLVDRTLLRPLPYGHPDRLVALWEQTPRRGGLRDYFSAADFHDWERETTRLQGLCALSSGAMNLGGGVEPLRVRVGRVSWTFTDVLEVRPLLGRGFLPEEDAPGAPKVALLTYEFWRRHGGDAAMVGRSLRLDGVDTLVVGVLPSGFDFAHRIAHSEVFTPLALTGAERANRQRHWLTGVARLKGGATRAEAELELKAVCERIAQGAPGTNDGYTARVAPLRDEVTKDAKGTLLALLGAVGFVFLIACTNVANLLLARVFRRSLELAVRSALGADRARILRLLLAESCLLGLLGGVMGWFASRMVLSGLAALLGLPPGAGGGWAQLGMALALSLGAALLSGFLPAYRFSAVNPGPAMREGARSSGTPGHHRLSRLLVAAETALATALLIGAGLLLRTLIHLQSVTPGFEPQAITIQVTLPGTRYRGNGPQGDFARRIQARLEAIPGVTGAAVMDNLPLSGSMRQAGYDLEPGMPPQPDQEAFCYRASPGYFRAMGIPLVRGRDFDPADRDAAIISESFARRHWKDQDPLGRRIFIDAEDRHGMTILGVVGDVRHEALAAPLRPGFYMPLLDPGPAYITAPGLVLVVKAQAPPGALLPAFKQALREVDPELPLGQVRTMGELMDLNRKDARARGILFGGFSLLALVLAGAGIFGVVSFLTGMRLREMGIRAALGATREEILGLVLGQGLRMLAAGGAVGLVMAFVLARTLQGQLHGVGPLDPLTYGLAVLLVGAAGTLACLVPAWKAARVDPAVALRNE
jgi:predicted permease